MSSSIWLDRDRFVSVEQRGGEEKVAATHQAGQPAIEGHSQFIK